MQQISSKPAYRLRGRTKLIHRENCLILILGKRTAKIEPFNTAMQAFLHTLTNGGTHEQIRDTFLASWGETAWVQASACLDYLLQRGFLEQVNLPHALNERDTDRFDRILHFFSEFESEEHSRFAYLEKLRNARVGLIGLGGAGSWVLYNLLCCGIGNLRLIDGDTVEASNLNRSILYNEDDIGVSKAQAARRAALRFAPRTQIETCEVFVSGAEMLVPYIQDLDLVIGMADQPLWLIKEWITQACHEARVPVLQAGGSRVGPFYIPGQSSCIMCDWAYSLERNPDLPLMMARQRQLPKGQTGSLSPWASVTSGIIGMETFRFLSGHNRPMTMNALWELHGDGTATIQPLAPHPHCKVCGETIPSILSGDITVIR